MRAIRIKTRKKVFSDVIVFFRQKARLLKVLPSVGRSRCRAKQVFEGLKRSNKAPAENFVLDSFGS